MATMETVALQKRALRTGPCEAVPPCGCTAFVFTKTMDTFPTCICQHTQHAHRMVGVILTGETDAD